MSLLTSISGAFDAWAAVYGDIVGRTVLKNCLLQTADTELEHALISDNGEFVSLIRILGRRREQDTEAMQASIASLQNGIASRLGGAAHTLQIVMSCDPGGSLKAVTRALAPSKKTAAALGLDIGGVIDDWAERVASYTAEESVYIACWTTRGAMTPAEGKRATKERMQKMKKTPHGLEVQNVASPVEGLRDTHRSFVGQTVGGCQSAGIIAEALTAHDALRVIREMVEPYRTNEDWKPLLPGDKLPIREPAPTDLKNESSWWMYPPVKQQIFNRNITEYSDTVVDIGGNLHHPVMVTLPAQNPQSFASLFGKLIQKPMAWRVSILIEGDGLRGITLRSSLASILHWASSENKMLNQAVKEARELHIQNESLVRYRVTADTWVKTSEHDAFAKLQNASDNLIAALQSWGQCTATDVIGDPTLGVCCTLPAVMRTAPSVPACAPLFDALWTSPLMRPASIWSSGPIPLRTPDGKLTPYMPGSSKQTAWVDLGVAPMGRGKSVWLNTQNFGFLLQPGLTELPYLSVIDVGPSSSGLIALLQASLPPERRHLALYKRLRMTREHSINPFDTELGCPHPLPAHKTFLVNFMTVLASSVDPQGRPIVYEGVTGISSMCIDLAYNEYAPDRNPKLYSHSVNPVVSKAVSELKIAHQEGETTWWEITQAIVEKGGELHLHAASVAQRYATPLLSEVAAKAKSQEVTAVYTNRTPGGDLLTDYIARTCGMEAVAAYPILGEETHFEIGQARVISLDLDEVVVRGAGASATKQNAVVYMLARQAAAARFFLMPEDVHLMPVWIRPFHEKRIDALRSLPKRLCFDEWHRVSAQPGVTQDITTTTRESRKWNLHLSLTSQDIEDYSKTMIELSTSKWILGYGTANGIKLMQQMLGLEPGAVNAITRLPPKPGAAGSTFLEIVSTDEGEVCQTVVNTLGSQILWSFSTTTEDATIRNKLYARLGTARTLKVLSKFFPGGSAKSEVERRREKAEGGDVILEMVEVLVREAEKE